MTPPQEDSGRADRLLTVEEVAARFNVPVSWVYSKAEAGDLPSLKLGRYRRFEHAAIAKFLDASRQGQGQR